VRRAMRGRGKNRASVLTDSSSNINIETATSLHVPHSLPFDRLASGLQTLARTL